MEDDRSDDHLHWIVNDNGDEDAAAPAFALPTAEEAEPLESSETIKDDQEVDLLNFSSHAAAPTPVHTPASTDLLGFDDFLSAPPTTTSVDERQLPANHGTFDAVDLLSLNDTPAAAVAQSDMLPVDLVMSSETTPTFPAEDATTAVVEDVFANNNHINIHETEMKANSQSLDDTNAYESVMLSSSQEEEETATVSDGAAPSEPIVRTPSMETIEATTDASTETENDVHNNSQLQEQLNRLQQESRDKDALIQQLIQQLATNTADSNEKTHALHQSLEQTRLELQTQQEHFQTSEASWQSRLDDLQTQLTASEQHAQGFKTDQARYRELQSLWSSEQSKRIQVENQVEQANAQITQLQALLETKLEELQSMQVKMETAANESSEQLQAAKDRVQVLEQEKETLQEQVQQLTVDETADSPETQLRQIKLQMETKTVELERLQAELEEMKQQADKREQDFQSLQTSHDEQHRKEMALTSRLNAAKKTEAEKANAAERLEDELEAVKDELEVNKLEVKNLQTAKEQLEHDFAKFQKTSQAKLEEAEAALKDERALNEERKKKMKAFVETKADELRQLQTDNEALQSEVATTSKSLMDLNNRWKQLHAQWVQSQTRNRELQRDLNRIKKDSENLHKVGDTIQMKLSRSNNETEEHKNKRLAAKHELMTVLRTLEVERELTGRLRDSIKFTFTPKALSQQQLIHEALDEFEAQLLKLSQRLSVPLPPMTTPVPALDLPKEASNGGDTATLDDDVTKLDHETQRVSQNIMSLSDNIERLRVILEMGSTRSCATVLGELLMTGGIQSSPAALPDDRTPMTGAGMNAIRSHRYGQVPRTSQMS